jgi:mercuric ion transport protein
VLWAVLWKRMQHREARATGATASRQDGLSTVRSNVVPSDSRAGDAQPSVTPRESRALGYFGLFSSVGTLLCCALPSLFVLLGFGATVASLLAAAPWLVSLSRQKSWVFAVSALLIAGNYYYVYRVAPRLLVERGACAPGDPGACARATRTSRMLLWTSAALLGVGFMVAYLLPIVLTWTDP